MTFQLGDFGTLGGQGKRDESFQLFSYISTDATSVVLASGYFNALKSDISSEDIIYVQNQSGDGTPTDYFVRIVTVPTKGNITAERTSIPLELSDTLGLEDTVAGTAGTTITVSRSDHTHPKTVATELVRGQSLLSTQAMSEAHTNDTTNMTPLKTEYFYQVHKSTLLEAQTGTETEQWISPATMQGHYDFNKATQSEAETGTNDIHYMTPDKTDDFYQIRKSSDVDVQTGTDTNKFVTPAGLSSRTATTTRTGLVEKGTQTEVNTGSDTDVYLTPETHANYPHVADLSISYLVGGIVSYNTASTIDVSLVDARSDNNTQDIPVSALTGFDITANASWATGTAPSLVSTIVYVFADYNSGTPRFILDDNLSGSNISGGVKRYVGRVYTDASSNILDAQSKETDGGGCEYEFRTYLSIGNTGTAQHGIFATTLGSDVSARVNVSAQYIDGGISAKVANNATDAVSGGWDSATQFGASNHDGYIFIQKEVPLINGSVYVSCSATPTRAGTALYVRGFVETRK